MTEQSEQNDPDILMKLANFRLDRAKDRRQLEWRFTATLWAALAAALYKAPCLSFWPFLIIVVAHSVWIGMHWARNERDSRKAFFYIDRIHRSIFGQMPRTERRLPDIIVNWLPLFRRRAERHDADEWPQIERLGLLGCFFDPMCWFQAVVTAGLAAAAYMAGQLQCGLPPTPH